MSWFIQKAAKYAIFAAVLASFVFIGYRIATKRAYVRHERGQCDMLAVSAALSAVSALSALDGLGAYVTGYGPAEFVIDHMKMPGNNVVSVRLFRNSGGFEVESKASSGWNSRSPQNSEFRISISVDGEVEFTGSDRQKSTAETLLSRHHPDKNGKDLLFTFPYERPCPYPFNVMAVKHTEGGEEFYILIYIQKTDRYR